MEKHTSEELDTKIIDFFKFFYLLKDQDMADLHNVLRDTKDEDKLQILNVCGKRYKEHIENGKKLLSDLKLVENNIVEYQEKTNADNILNQL